VEFASTTQTTASGERARVQCTHERLSCCRGPNLAGGGIDAPAIQQTSVQVFPLRTVYTFQGAGVELKGAAEAHDTLRIIRLLQ